LNVKKRNIWLVIILTVAVVLAVGGVAGWKWHEKPSFCSTVCHKVMTPYVDSWSSGSLLAHQHAQANLTCLACHEPKISEQLTEAKKYVTGRYSTPLAPVSMPSSFCLKCHGSYEELAKKTANYEYAGVRVNPHSRLVDPSSTDDPHNSPNAKPIECQDCHRMHEASPGIEYCFGCHHQKNFKKCTDCHTESQSESAGGV
jgi:formate-dependent nitrite reductase cytochrome c552 subunit